MPIVRAQRQIQLAPTPGARKTAHETAISSGVGLAEAQAQSSQALGQIGEGVARLGTSAYANIVAEERRAANETAVLKAATRLALFKNKWLTDAETGVLNIKGEAAQALPELTYAAFQKESDAIESELKTPEQRAAFAPVKTQQLDSIDLTVRRHTMQEMNTFRAEELEGFLKNTVSSAISNATDPAASARDLKSAQDMIDVHAPRLGQGKQAVEQQKLAVATAVHAGVIGRLTALDKYAEAKTYFEAHHDEIKGEALAQVENALEVSGQRKESQTKADAIVAAGGTITEQRAKARGIEDAEVRDQVMSRIEHEWTVKEQATADALHENMNSAYAIIDKTRNVNSVPPALWAKVPEAWSLMRSYAAQRAKGQPIETDRALYYRQLELAGDDPAKFISAENDLLQYRAKLDDPEFNQLAHLRLSIKAGNMKAVDKDLAPFRTNDQVLKDTLVLYGLPPNPEPGTKEDAAVAQLRRMLDQRVENFETLTGKKPQNQDIQMMLDGIMSTSVKVPGSWWNIWPGGESFTATTKRLIDTTIRDVPAPEKKMIEDALRGAGRPVSDATVLNFYIEIDPKAVLAEKKAIEDALRRAGKPVSDATVLNLYIETKLRLEGKKK